jgi:hypothetical protein
MFRFKDEDKEQNIEKTKSLLLSLNGKISELKKMEVGLNEIDDMGASDLVLYSEFDSFEDLSNYQINPYHQEVLAFIKSVISERRVVDYQK